MTFKSIGEEIIQECVRASGRYPPFNSAHEGYAIILEELEELKTEIFKKQSSHDMKRMRKEAIQVGAMALRFVNDIAPISL